MDRRSGLSIILGTIIAVSTTVRAADPVSSDARPFPAMQVLPLPYDQASFEHLGRELTRYHFGENLRRPFWYPILGPDGRSLTRMGKPDDPGKSLTRAEQPKDPKKPEDPLGHSHQNSIWISHKDVNGVDFWRDGGPIAGQIVHQPGREGLQYEDGPAASMLSRNAWNDPQGKTLMFERRRTTVMPGEDGSWWLIVDVQFEAPPGIPVTLGKTPFGPIGVRMARTIGVTDGGGRILNSEGQRNEAEAFRKAARWADYSGPITPSQTAGITLMDHPENTGHPTPFHVRNDGWMGACLTIDKPIVIPPDKPLRLRYGLWVHPSIPDGPAIERQWQSFIRQPLASMEMKKPAQKAKSKP